MPFPATVTLSAAQGIVGNATPGPIQVGANLYIFIGGTASPNHLTPYKSTDGGFTWNPLTPSAGQIAALSLYNCILVGTTIYCVGQLLITGNLTCVVIPFDTTSDTFGALVNTGRIIQNGIGSPAVSSMAACYRPSDNSIVICSYITNVTNPLRTFYFVFDLGSMTAGAQIACGETGADPNNWQCMYAVHANGFTQFLFLSTDLAGFTAIHIQALSDAGALGAVQDIDSTASTGDESIFASTDGNTVLVGWTIDAVTLKVWSGISADPIVLTEHDATYTGSESGFPDVTVVRGSDGSNYLFVTGTPTGYFVDSGAGYGAFVDLGHPFDSNAYALPLTSFTWGYIPTDSTGIFFFGGGSPPPVASGGLIRMKVPEPAFLPDPKILCNFSHPQPCGDELDCRNYTIQGTKGVYGRYE